MGGSRGHKGRWRSPLLLTGILLVVVPVALLAASSLHPIQLPLFGHGVLFGRVNPETEQRYQWMVLKQAGQELTAGFVDWRGRPSRDSYILAWW